MAFDLILAISGLCLWFYLFLGRGGFWRIRTEPADRFSYPLPGLVVVIPARNEAEGIGQTVTSLLQQDLPHLNIVLVDDHSTDGTAEIARTAAKTAGKEQVLHIVNGAPLSVGWSGKVWAQAQGIAYANEHFPDEPYLLLTDGDIEHAPNSINRLLNRAETENLDLVSLMVRLSAETLIEKLLIPPFVFFFQKLYPFEWVNRAERTTAAAAGGCMLVRRSTLARIGGINAIRDRLIDDCALAQKIKSVGPIWLGLAEHTRSLRRYTEIKEVWMMIARTAFTQLRYSTSWVVLSASGMIATYLAPPVIAISRHGELSGWFALAAWVVMTVSYLPMIRYYRLSPFWAFSLPVAAFVFMGATLDSCWRYWRGRGGEWKGRVQARRPT